MKTGEPSVARLAVEAVARTDKKTDAVSSLLDSDEPHHWFYAGALLARSCEEILPGVLDKLRSRRKQRRMAAVCALTAAPCREAVDALMAMAKYKPARLRQRIAEALGACGDARAADTLIDRLEGDTDYAVRAQAAW